MCAGIKQYPSECPFVHLGGLGSGGHFVWNQHAAVGAGGERIRIKAAAFAPVGRGFG